GGEDWRAAGGWAAPAGGGGWAAGGGRRWGPPACGNSSQGEFVAFGGSDGIVVGPLALVGGRAYTDPFPARPSFWLKMPALVRPGHVVRLRIAQAAPRTTGFVGYDSRSSDTSNLARSRASVTFTACRKHSP